MDFFLRQKIFLMLHLLYLSKIFNFFLLIILHFLYFVCIPIKPRFLSSFRFFFFYSRGNDINTLNFIVDDLTFSYNLFVIKKIKIKSSKTGVGNYLPWKPELGTNFLYKILRKAKIAENCEIKKKKKYRTNSKLAKDDLFFLV